MGNQLRFIWVPVCVCLLLASCGREEMPQQSSSDSTSSAIASVAPEPVNYSHMLSPDTIDLEDLDALYVVFLEDVFHSVVTGSTWDDPEQVDPERLTAYYLIRLSKDDKMRPDGELAAELEAGVQRHFDVSSEHLRKSCYYKPDTGLYVFEGWGGAAEARITSAKLDDNLLTIAFDVFGGGIGEPVWCGELSVELNGDSYKYVGNKQWDYVGGIPVPSGLVPTEISFDTTLLPTAQLPPGLADNANFKQALTRPSVICYDSEVLTDSRAVKAFIAGEIDCLSVYRFRSQGNVLYWMYERSDNPQTPYLVYTASGMQADTLAPVLDGVAQSVWLNDYGGMTVNYIPLEQDFTTVVSGYELYPDYAQRVALREQYLLPIEKEQPVAQEWSSAESLTNWMYIYQSLYSVQNNGNSPWGKYGNNWKVDDMYAVVSEYFDLPYEAFLTKLKVEHDYDAATGTIYYEGGRGGYYPTYMVTTSRRSGDLLELDYYMEDYDNAPVAYFGNRTLTVRLAEDGSFKYISNKKAP